MPIQMSIQIIGIFCPLYSDIEEEEMRVLKRQIEGRVFDINEFNTFHDVSNELL